MIHTDLRTFKHTAFLRILVAFCIPAATACSSDEAGSSRLKGLKEGMELRKALEVMGDGPLTATLADTVRVVRGYRRMSYFINGSTYQVLYAREIPGDVKEPLLQAKETPVVFRNDTLLGWGWKYYAEEAMPKLQLPTPLRAIDTMTTSPTDSSEAAGPSVETKSAPAAPDTLTKS